MTTLHASSPFVQHLIFSREHTANKITFTRSALVEAKLHQLDAEMFPIPKYNLSPSKDFACKHCVPSSLSDLCSILGLQP